jgi:hypothetical protein
MKAGQLAGRIIVADIVIKIAEKGGQTGEERDRQGLPMQVKSWQDYISR